MRSARVLIRSIHYSGEAKVKHFLFLLYFGRAPGRPFLDFAPFVQHFSKYQFACRLRINRPLVQVC